VHLANKSFRVIARTLVEFHVAVVADNDRVGEVGILVAHRAGKLKRQLHPLDPLAGPRYLVADLHEAMERQTRGQRVNHDDRGESHEEATSGPRP
jgi:hypothetical protein